VAGFISDSLRERIRAASDIVDVIGSYIPLKRAGANFTALCPFHKEKTPSFNVNPQKQIFHCFGCHKGGDVFTFVKEYENIGFVDAMRRLADRAKIEMEFDTAPGAQESRHLKDTLLQIHEQIAQRWQNCLANEAAGQKARDYLAKRGVSEEAIKLFRLGSAPDAWDDTVNWATSKGHELAAVEKAGLIIKREGADGSYDRFRGRLMFPICDEQGRVIGFSGRVLDADAKTAKYVNSPETPIFTKSKVFFGLDKSRRAILDAGFAIVCEGQLDLIACFMAGVQNVVAPQGTAFTEQHARILKRYVDEVVLCFDSDAAGQNAAVRSHDSLLASGLAVRVAVVTAPHDPDSFIKANGGEAFKKLIDGADGFFDYLLIRLCEQNDISSDKGRLVVLRSMGEAVQKTGNRVLLDKYAQKTALRLGVAPEAVRVEFKKVAAGRNAAGERFDTDEELSSQTAVEIPRPSAPELWLLKLVLKYDATLDWLVAHLDPDWIPHAAVKEIISRRLAAHAENSWQSLAAFLDGFDSAETRSLITEVTLENREIPNPEQQLLDITLRLRNQNIERELAVLTHRSSQPEMPEEERLNMLREQQQLRQLKRSPLAPLSPF
jgi:DNA primase